MDKYLFIKDQCKSNDLDAFALEGAVSISVFEFECELSKEDTIRLRDFLDMIIESNAKSEVRNDKHVAEGCTSKHQVETGNEQ